MTPNDEAEDEIYRIARTRLNPSVDEMKQVEKCAANFLGVNKDDAIKCYKLGEETFENESLRVYVMEVKQGCPLYKYKEMTKDVSWFNETELDQIYKDHRKMFEKLIYGIKRT
jgi:hypothetical protein